MANLELAHNAFEAELADVLEDGRTVFLDVVIEQMPWPAPARTEASVALRTSRGPVGDRRRISINGFFELNGRVILSSCRNSDEKS